MNARLAAQDDDLQRPRAVAERRAARVATLMASLVAVVFGAFVIASMFHRSLGYDEAVFDAVAKNVALGQGYATTYDSRSKFDPIISSGPVLIYPAALAIAALGNKAWVPRLVTLAMILGLAGCLVRFAGNHLTRARASWVALAVLTGWLLFTSETPRAMHHAHLGEGGFLRLWYEFMGEIPAALMVTTGIALAVCARDRLAWLVMAGLLLGAAIQIKTLSAVTVPALLLLPLVYVSSIGLSEQGRPHWRAAVVAFALFAGALYLPSFAWDRFRQLTLYLETGSRSAWWELVAAEKQLLSGNGSGVAELLAAPRKLAFLWSTSSQNLARITDYCRGIVPVLAAAILTVGALFIALRETFRSRFRSPVAVFTAVLLLGALCHLGWWVLLSSMSFNIRHMMMGALYLVTALAFSLALPMTRVTRGLAVLLVLVVIVPRVRDLTVLADLPVRDEPSLRATSEVANLLSGYAADPRVILLGCGWWANRELEYLMPGTLNFRDCNRVSASEYRERTALLVRGPFWNWEDDPKFAAFAAACEREMLLEIQPFAISRCHGPPTRM